MLCAECKHPLPPNRTTTTICLSCKTPLATWWDESTGTHRTNRESLLPSMPPSSAFTRRNTATIEERVFGGALTMVDLHFALEGGRKLGPKSAGDVRAMMAKTLEKSLNRSEVRETLAKNVDIWLRLQQIFTKAIERLRKNSLRQDYNEGVPESATLILQHYTSLKEDLQYLNNLLVISRNMLAIKETAQELCRRVGFDRCVRELVVLCVGVTSKGYDGESVPEESRTRLVDITELYKKLLVTCLQHTHNWTMGNDRFKMIFWFDMLFDNEWETEVADLSHPAADGLDVKAVRDEMLNWMKRYTKRDAKALEIIKRYEDDPGEVKPGDLPKDEEVSESQQEETTTPVWKPELANDKEEQDRQYGRVSHQIDCWWKINRDANYDGWVVPMETVDGAKERAEQCKVNAMHRYIPSRENPDQNYDSDPHYEEQQPPGSALEDEDQRSLAGENGVEDEEEDEEDEDDSYVEGPLRGLLTEIPNILDTKQIEALHMTVKACIVDSMGSGLTNAGENLQKTRCKMFLALDCGKNLLREMLVFIAVWEQTDQQFIFQITAQIIESFHHNALLPYAWNSLRILKDIVSPAQTVLLRLINYMFRARKDSSIYEDLKDYNRDAKLIHFLYNYFRCRVVPDCVALIHAQTQIRQQKSHPNDFPVDLWDMERAKDGLSQYLDFISVIAEIPEMRHLLIEWDCVYELVTLLKNLEAGVARKTLDESNRRTTSDPAAPPPAPVPPLHDTPHKFAWPGIKIQILIILTSLIAPTNPRRIGPGNPIVQKQLLAHNGIMPLLNCCVYDGHNEYLKERATLAIKFIMEGCEEAQKFVRELVPMKQATARTKGRESTEKVIATQQQLEENMKSLKAGGAGDGVEEAKERMREQGLVLEGDEEAEEILREHREAEAMGKGKGKEKSES